ncbi:WhiB family transcriptional regulator [Kitasatospora sp. NPDC057542]|uniref:WhiB family transcriptional regulator n=1 Tax=Kitasatospora sp. NPDC057542 TaxID=3346162 RepID=UPI0036B45A0E
MWSRALDGAAAPRVRPGRHGGGQPNGTPARCPVLLECRRYAMTVREPYDVWGGLTGDALREARVDQLPGQARGLVRVPRISGTHRSPPAATPTRQCRSGRAEPAVTGAGAGPGAAREPAPG